MNAAQRDVYRQCSERHEGMIAANDKFGTAYRRAYYIGGKAPNRHTDEYAAYRAGIDRRLYEEETKRETKPMDAIDTYHVHNLERRLDLAKCVGAAGALMREAMATLVSAKTAPQEAREHLIDEAITELQAAIDAADGHP